MFPLVQSEEQLLNQCYELNDWDKIEAQEEKLDSLIEHIKKDDVHMNEVKKQDNDFHEKIIESDKRSDKYQALSIWHQSTQTQNNFS